MGRVRFFRQRVQTEASSVMAKSLSEYLTSEIRARREVSPEEAALIASDCMEYLQRYLGLRKLGEIEFPAVLAEGAHFRRKREDQEERLVKLTVISDDDANVLSEHGAQVMQISRMARVIEEASLGILAGRYDYLPCIFAALPDMASHCAASPSLVVVVTVSRRAGKAFIPFVTSD